MAELAARAGAAIQLPREEVTPAAVADAVDKLLTDPAYRDNARRIAQQTDATPPPEDLARQLAAA